MKIYLYSTGFILRPLHDRTKSYRKFFQNECSVFQRDPEIIQPTTQGKSSSVPSLYINPFECRDAEAQGKEVETAAMRTKSWSISMCRFAPVARLSTSAWSTSFLCPPPSRGKSKCLRFVLKLSRYQTTG